MGKVICKSKDKKNPSKPQPDGLKPQAIKWEKKLQVEKQKNLSRKEPDGLKPKPIKWEKKLQVKKQK